MAQNLVKLGVSMKTFFTIVLFLCFLPTYSQIGDSLLLFPATKMVIEGNKILLNGRTSNFNSHLELLYFDGTQWNNFSKDTLPFSFNQNCYFTPSKFSVNIFVSTIKHLWEYDGKNWIPHSISDSLDGIRNFDEIIELPDSSFVLFSTHYINKFDSTSSDSIIVNYKELQKFKDGKFTTLKTILYENKNIFGLKKNVNGSFSFNTYNVNPQKGGREILTFSLDGQLLRTDRYPDLTPFGYNQVGGYVKFQDYLLDSKGSFWHLVYTPALYDAPKHARMVEVTLTGEIFLYNEDIGLPSPWNPMPNTFEIDENDNIWFNFYYNLEHSIFKLHSDRKTLTEFQYEDIRKNSFWYIGGYNGYQKDVFVLSNFSLLKCLQDEKSIVLFIYPYPLIKFFPEKVTSLVKEQSSNPIQLYPNPVQSGNMITIESSTFEKVNNPLSVVLRDISGATVRDNVISAIGNLLSINTEGLIRGTYFVSVLNNNKIILQTNFVKE